MSLIALFPSSSVRALTISAFVCTQGQIVTITGNAMSRSRRPPSLARIHALFATSTVRCIKLSSHAMSAAPNWPFDLPVGTVKRKVLIHKANKSQDLPAIKVLVSLIAVLPSSSVLALTISAFFRTQGQIVIISGEDAKNHFDGQEELFVRLDVAGAKKAEDIKLDLGIAVKHGRFARMLT